MAGKGPTDSQDSDIITAECFAVLLYRHAKCGGCAHRSEVPFSPLLRCGAVPVVLNSPPFPNLSNGHIYRVGVNGVSSDGVGRDLIRCGSRPQGMCAIHTWGNYMAL